MAYGPENKSNISVLFSFDLS